MYPHHLTRFPLCVLALAPVLLPSIRSLLCWFSSVWRTHTDNKMSR
uniref:Uncharacterized protein n=1 Tax=Anopheles funestus TaxID=62324 RepID=A0A182S344_ANOFN